MSDRRRALGAAGEDAAARHLAGLGYQILERNFRTRYGELDIVASGQGCLVFCEVKSRLGRAAGQRALDSVGPGKRRRIRRMAAEWFSRRPSSGQAEVRFDAIGVAVAADGSVLELEHVPDAF